MSDDPLCKCGHPESKHTGKDKYWHNRACVWEGTAPDGGWTWCGCRDFRKARDGT